jgi:hypothetical protein
MISVASLRVSIEGTSISRFEATHESRHLLGDGLTPSLPYLQPMRYGQIDMTRLCHEISELYAFEAAFNP